MTKIIIRRKRNSRILYAFNIQNITVFLGTAFNDIPLPGVVDVGLSDGELTRFPVSWSSSGYDGNVVATYQITGVILAPGFSGGKTVSVGVSVQGEGIGFMIIEDDFIVS